MTRPKRSDAYPATFLHALRKVAETGEDLIIPTTSPDAMRLSYNSIFGALRNEGKPELPSLVSIVMMPEKAGIIIRAKDAMTLSLDVEKALAGASNAFQGEAPPPIEDEYEAALARILGGEKP